MKPVLLIAVVLAWTANTAEAVTSCKGKIDKKDGTILVSANGVTTNLKWGATSDAVVNTFINEGTCVADGRAKKCTFDTPGTELAKTPPALCTVFLEDDQGTCSAHLSGCTPGYRLSTDRNGATQKWVRASSSAWGNPIDLSGVDAGDATMADLVNDYFVVPVDGVYQFSGWVSLAIAGGVFNELQFENVTNSPAIIHKEVYSSNEWGGYAPMTTAFSFVAHLNAGDHIVARYLPGGLVQQGGFGPQNVVINMALIQ